MNEQAKITTEDRAVNYVLERVGCHRSIYLVSKNVR